MTRDTDSKNTDTKTDRPGMDLGGATAQGRRDGGLGAKQGRHATPESAASMASMAPGMARTDRMVDAADRAGAGAQGEDSLAGDRAADRMAMRQAGAADADDGPAGASHPAQSGPGSESASGKK